MKWMASGNMEYTDMDRIYRDRDKEYYDLLKTTLEKHGLMNLFK